jgi:heme/copper-type cytochrome/quinol oxidase subunit 2
MSKRTLLLAHLLALLGAGLVQGMGVTLQYAIRLALEGAQFAHFPDGLAMARIFIPVGLGTWLVIGLVVLTIWWIRHRRARAKQPDWPAWAFMGAVALASALTVHPEILSAPTRLLASLFTTALAAFAGYSIIRMRLFTTV